MIRLRLTHGMSHSNGIVSATWKNPYVTVETEEAAAACVADGFFEIVKSDNILPDAPKMEALAAPDQTDNDEGNADNAAPPAVEAPDSGTDEEDELEGMTVAELRGYAETTGVELGRLTKKADIIAAIRKAEAEG